jgi:hypothetical protein
MRIRRARKNGMAGVLATLVVIALVLALAGCDVGGESVAPDIGFEQGDGFAVEDEAVSTAEAPATRASGTGADAANIPQEDRLIIRDKSLRMEVEDVRGTVEEVRDIADAHDALVTNVNVTSDDGPIYRYDEYGSTTGSGAALSGWITLRVPAGQYESFIDDASSLGEILWEGESIDDVTQQHVDLSARLANLEAEEVRLREFFDAAQNVEEMLLVEQELVRVRGEIESLTAQIAYLERQAAMATVTIELSEPAPVVRPDGPDWGFTRAITAGLQLAANVVKAIIVVALGALPLVLLGGVLFLIVRAIVKSRRRKRVVEAAGAGPDA